MIENLFTNLPINICIQGSSVLSYVGCTEKYLKYSVIGFNKPKIIIFDYRKNIREKIDIIFETEQFSKFPTLFNHSATLDLKISEKKDLSLYLYDTNYSICPNVLQIAIGIENWVPIQSYLHLEFNQLEGNKIAFFGLYRRQNEISYSVEKDYLTVYRLDGSI